MCILTSGRWVAPPFARGWGLTHGLERAGGHDRPLGDSGDLNSTRYYPLKIFYQVLLRDFIEGCLEK
ncbi:hypothetical protein L484_017278 [Morus notabilis]|uniref:Uncharacterized protein n=1 Tax=Morus notabilis TaxID=981085 RepID=W9SHA0_9ROSA|nr:hypothetical protein L484_017278 [Morus notabilis]